MCYCNILFSFSFLQNDYEKIYSDYTSQLLHKYASSGLVHTGSWRVHIGNVQNQFIHIWMYKNFAQLDQFLGGVQLGPINDKLNETLVQRSNQICLSFSYFGLFMHRSETLFSSFSLFRNSSTSSKIGRSIKSEYLRDAIVLAQTRNIDRMGKSVA